MAGITDLGAPLCALVVNRMHPWPPGERPARLLASSRSEAFEADVRILAAAMGESTDAPDPGALETARRVATSVLSDARACALEQDRFDALKAAARSRGIPCLPVA